MFEFQINYGCDCEALKQDQIMMILIDIEDFFVLKKSCSNNESQN